jgi:hypothetical protein
MLSHDAHVTRISNRHVDNALKLHGMRYVNTLLYRSSSNLEIKIRGLSPRANYIDRATTACRRSKCRFLRIEAATWSA